MRIESASAGPSRASQALLRIIRAEFGTVERFAAAASVGRIKLQKAIKGELRRIDISFAFKVKRATRDRIPFEWWLDDSENIASAPTGTEG
jgi:hypothetical protein